MSPLGRHQGWSFRNPFAPVVHLTVPQSSRNNVGIAGVKALRMIVPAFEYETFDLAYLNYDGDGGGGTFVYNPTDNHPDDGIDYIIPHCFSRPTRGTLIRSK